MNWSALISEESVRAYGQFMCGKLSQPSPESLYESWYFHDAAYTRSQCLEVLSVAELQRLPLPVFVEYFDSLELQSKAEMLSTISEMECKAFILYKVPTKPELLEYIEEIGSDDSILTSASTVVSDLESTCISFNRGQLCQYIVDEISREECKLDSTSVRKLIAYAENLHFTDEETAEQFINLKLRNISLSGNGITTVELRSTRYLRALDLSNNCIGNSEMPKICILVQEGSISRLKIDHNRFTEESAQYLIEALPGSIHDLNISGNNFGAEIRGIISKLSASQYLQTLDISFNGLSFTWLEEALEVLIEGAQSLALLRCFDENIDPGISIRLRQTHPFVDIEMNENVTLEMVEKCEDEEVRRELERALLYSSDSLAGGSYYLVSNAWLEEWKAYITGAERPGQLDNSNPDEQFRAVNADVWRILSRLYGGGPEMKTDISAL